MSEERNQAYDEIEYIQNAVAKSLILGEIYTRCASQGEFSRTNETKKIEIWREEQYRLRQKKKITSKRYSDTQKKKKKSNLEEMHDQIDRFETLSHAFS